MFTPRCRCPVEAIRLGVYQVYTFSSLPINMVEKEGKMSQSPFAQSDRPSSDLAVAQTHLNLRRTSGDSSNKVLQSPVASIVTLSRPSSEPKENIDDRRFSPREPRFRTQTTPSSFSYPLQPCRDRLWTRTSSQDCAVQFSTTLPLQILRQKL